MQLAIELNHSIQNLNQSHCFIRFIWYLLLVLYIQTEGAIVRNNVTRSKLVNESTH